MLGRYQVAFYDNRGRLVLIHSLTGADQLAYSKQVCGVGKFMMSLPRTLLHPVMAQKDAMAQVYRVHPQTGQMTEDGTYFLRSFDYVPGTPEGFVVSGFSAEHLLTRRAYLPDDDPLVANGFSTKGGSAVRIMREIVTEQLISPTSYAERPVPGLSIAPHGEDGLPNYYFRSEFKKQTVLDVLQAIHNGTQPKIDFWLEFAGIDTVNGYPTFEFHCGTLGVDRSKHSYPDGPYCYLTASSGNLLDPQLTIDSADEKSVVFVLGKGANGQRLVYRQSSSTVSDSPFNVIEDVVEVNEADTADEYIAAADTGLVEREAKITFTFVPLVGAGGAVYEQDFDLGTIVTTGHLGLEFDMRVMGLNVTLVSGSETIAVETELQSWD